MLPAGPDGSFIPRQRQRLPLTRARRVCRSLGLRHLLTEPYRPRTNGKAERFIRTLTERWAYGSVYLTNQQRRHALPGFLDHYNYRRPHRALNREPPIQRLAERNNLAGTYT